jgi:DNA-binding HxlR family transcriptional regulator
MTKLHAKMLTFHLKDMQDWNAIQRHQFRPVSSMFDLKEAIQEIYDMMKIKADLKNIFCNLNLGNVPNQVIGDKFRFQ